MDKVKRWAIMETETKDILSVVGIPVVLLDKTTKLLYFYGDAELAIFNGRELAYGLLSLCAKAKEE